MTRHLTPGEQRTRAAAHSSPASAPPETTWPRTTGRYVLTDKAHQLLDGQGVSCRCDWLGEGTPENTPSPLCRSLRPNADRDEDTQPLARGVAPVPHDAREDGQSTAARALVDEHALRQVVSPGRPVDDAELP